MSNNLLNKINSQSASLAQTLRDYLVQTYEFDITQLRCPDTGTRLERISDSDLVGLYQANGSDLVALSEAIEYRIAYLPVSTLFFNKSIDRLASLATTNLWQFFCYGLGYLIGYNLTNVSLIAGDRLNRPSTEHRASLRLDYFRLIERLESLTDAEADRLIAQLPDLNNSLILLLACGGVAKLESSGEVGRLTTDKVYDLVAANKLLDYLNGITAKLANYYKLAHKLPLDHKLTLADIQKISQSEYVARQARKQTRLDEIETSTARLNAYTASLSNHWQSIKRATTKRKASNRSNLSTEESYELDQMLGELNYLAQTDSAKADYIKQANKKATNLLITSGNVTINYNKINKLIIKATAKPVDQSRGTAIDPSQPNGLRKFSLSELFANKSNDNQSSTN